MPDFWVDTDNLISGKNGFFGFELAPTFWQLLEEKAKDGIIAFPDKVGVELCEGSKDDPLRRWAREARAKGFFVEPDEACQKTYTQVADYVNCSYPAHKAATFLDGADGWLVAYAKTYGGRVVTTEKSEPNAKKPKIPNICDHFGVQHLTFLEMLREIGASISVSIPPVTVERTTQLASPPSASSPSS